MDFEKLKIEIALPAYDGMTDKQIAASLNAPNITRVRTTISGSEILNATDSAEFIALTDAQKSSWMAICAVDTVNTTVGIAKALEAVLFGAETTTRANLIAIKNELISKATKLELGQRVRSGDIEHTRTI